MTIPASKLVSILPGVIGVGGAALALSGLVLTADTSVPIGAIRQYSDATAVGDYFGYESPEKAIADVYFQGFDTSTQKPANILFAQYPTAPVAAYLRSASLAGMSLSQLQAISPGVMTVTVDGALKTSGTITPSGFTSFSDAAADMTTAFATGPVITYDAQLAAFVATSATTGIASTITFAAGAIATALKLTSATGAVTSQGSAAAVPSAFMDSIVAVALNWASFMTVFEPLTADKLLFAAWTSSKNDRFAYMAWDTDVQATTDGSTTAFQVQANDVGLSGIAAYTADPALSTATGVSMTDLTRPLAAFAMGYMASLDFDRVNGRTTAAYRGQAGLATGIANATVADIAIANGYNFYGDYATSQQQFRLLQPGQISGRFAWLDSYANQIWMNANFQQELVSFLSAAGSVAYNNQGYSQLETVLQTPINSALNFGAIRGGVSLSGSQIIAVNSAAGQKIDDVLSTRGWYLSIRDPGPATRAARGTPVMTFFYCDGGSIQQIVMASLLVQ